MNDLKQTWHALRIIKGWHGAGVSSAGSMASLTVDAPSGRLQTITETLQRYNLFMVAEQDGAPEDQIPQERMTMYANSYVLTRQDGERLWFLIIDKAQGNLAMARMQFEKAIETHAS